MNLYHKFVKKVQTLETVTYTCVNTSTSADRSQVDISFLIKTPKSRHPTRVRFVVENFAGRFRADIQGASDIGGYAPLSLTQTISYLTNRTFKYEKRALKDVQKRYRYLTEPES